jgi:hypothetical protein
MTEWYVYCEGSTPKHIVMGRREAIRHITRGFKITDGELRRIQLFCDGVMPSLHEPFILVGYETNNGSWTKDRSITRVTGPGTEV